MAGTGGATRLIANGADNSKKSISLRRVDDARALIQINIRQGRVGTVTDITGFRFDIGGVVNLGRGVGKFDLTVFVINPYILDFLKLADVLNNLIDVVPGINHHGIMGAQPDCARQPVGAGDNISHGLLFLIIYIEVSPDR